MSERLPALVGLSRRPSASRIVVWPASPPPRMTFTPAEGCHLSALMPRKQSMVRQRIVGVAVLAVDGVDAGDPSGIYMIPFFLSNIARPPLLREFWLSGDAR